jgi:hypothetical protein
MNQCHPKVIFAKGFDPFRGAHRQNEMLPGRYHLIHMVPAKKLCAAEHRFLLRKISLNVPFGGLFQQHHLFDFSISVS